MISKKSGVTEESVLSSRNGFETSLAPREGDLLSLPFDQYGRMRVAQNIAHILYTEINAERTGQEGANKLRVLDVGGFPGMLPHFLSDSNFDLSVLDVVPDDGSIPGYIQGSGTDLPFEDASFDLVFSLDTLEHIPAPDRDRFLSEIRRVARLGIVLINPIQSVQTDLAEEMLNEYVRWLLDAQQEQLAEHRAFGLPDFARTAGSFEPEGWLTGKFTLANVYNWLLMMVAKHYLLSLRDDRASAFEKTLDRFYNLTFNESDRSDPPYRGAIVAVRPGLETVLHRVGEMFPSVPSSEASNAVRLQLTEVLVGLLNLKVANHEDHLLREQMERRDKQIADMSALLALKDVEIDRLNIEIKRQLGEMERRAYESDREIQRQVAEVRRRDADIVNLQAAHAEENETRARQLARLEEHVANIQAAYTAEFANQKSYIGRLEDDVRSKDEHILYLERLLQGIESGRVFRLTRTFSRFLGRR